VNDFVRPESMQVPEGGLASFLTATVGDWADTEEQVPATGIGGVKAVADQLAEYGRYEDTYMVHAAEGETVIPMAVFDENPRLKASLFSQMRAMGIDPEQYVVGSELNSLNPVTGQPEFFLKKLFKGLKKAVKKVVKVIKKVAPLVLSVGLAMTPLGAIAGSALGSGIGTLIQGGSLKDALKMGAIGGLTAGLFKGVQGGFRAMKANQGFGTGFRAGVSSGLPGGTPYTPAGLPDVVESQGVAGPASIPTEPVATGAGTVDPITRAPIGINPDALATSGAPLGQVPPGQGFTGPSILDSANSTAVPVSTGTDSSLALGDAYYQTPAAQVPTVSSSLPTDSINVNALGRSGRTDALTGLPADVPKFTSNIPMTPEEYLAQKASSVPPVQASDTAVDLLKKTVPDVAGDVAGDVASSGPFQRLGSSVQDFFRAPVESTKQLFFPKSTSPIDLVAEELGRPGATVEELLADKTLNLDMKALGDKLTTAKNFIADSGMNPGLIRKYGPLAAAGTGILALTTDGQAEMGESIDPFGQDFKTGADLYRENPGKYSLFPQFYNNYNYAHGGNVEEFPRRDGAIAGPGTGTSDDIPAMLSDGEFVMTAKSVRGAGNGSRNKGVKKMYEIMRTYEGVA
jgi:hypothetical protein